MRIMLIDPSKESRDEHRATLATLGYKDVVEAQDGQDALARVAADAPDMLVVENDMPGMSGLAFVDTYHQRGGTAPILLVDGAADHDKVKAAIRAGVASFVLKPVDQDTFAQHVLKTLAKRKSA
ncbi:MAG: response regulator [Phycisphaera sp.]|nr:response regulator [Phycisphaera sp.]